ncbi:hypothetical protein [Acinetobacter sp. P1(2025)]|uniref:hypothetical protein n=1 Tax=Acinetobacter sp. P1(2025) TaxID=3446120 RepID=UPI003F52F133
MDSNYFFGILVFLIVIGGLLAVLFKDSLPNLKQSKIAKLNDDPKRKQYFTEFLSYIKSLHLNIAANGSSVEGGLIYDEKLNQYVGEYSYVQPKQSKTPFGMYVVTFKTKAISAHPISYQITANDVEISTGKKESGSNAVEQSLEPKIIEYKECVSAFSFAQTGQYSADNQGAVVYQHTDSIEAVNRNTGANNAHKDHHQPKSAKEEITPRLKQSFIEKELNDISGRVAKKSSHKFLHGNRVASRLGVFIAKKRVVLKIDNQRKGTDQVVHSALEIHKGDLLIPLQNIHGETINYQIINLQQAKRFRIGASIKGGFFVIGEDLENVDECILCEDYLTGDTLHRVTGKTVVVCFDIQNIETVGNAINGVYSHLVFVIAGSRDIITKSKAKIKKALSVALAFNCPFVLPKFPNDVKYDQYKTWNDLQKVLDDDALLQIYNNQMQYFYEHSVEDAVVNVDRFFKLEMYIYN